MNVIQAKDYEQICRIATELIAAQIHQKPSATIGLATGSSPLGIYRMLIEKNRAGDLDFSRVRTVNLDEYVGIEPTREQSYLQFMRDNLFDHINIPKDAYHVPNGIAADVAAECARYDALIRDGGGVDLQLLGIGHDGHIGFNEPADHFVYGTNCVDLTQQTIEANQRFFDSIDDVPTQAITMGIGDIMAARSIVMVISGSGKAEILKAALYGPVTPQVPASILQFHPNCTVIADEAALGLSQ